MSDSVGKISLDLEVKTDILKQIENVSSKIAGVLKKNLQGATSEVFNGLKNGMKKSISSINNALTTSMGNIKKSIQDTLSSLKNIKLKAPKISFGKSQNQTEVSKTATSEKTSRAPPGESNAAGSTSLLSKAMSKCGSIIKGLTSGNKKLRESFDEVSGSTKKTTTSFKSANGGFTSFLGTMLKSLNIFGLIKKGLGTIKNAFIDNVKSNLMSNKEFCNSLAQIKTNLLAAFTPIYCAILPAIQAFMRILSKVTGMIASFTNAIFGTTYKASIDTIKSLSGAKDAMKAYGDSAKDTAESVSSALVPVDTSSYDESMKGLAETTKNLFQPILEALKNESQNTINSILNALNSVWELIKSIGASFEAVWMNGTGQNTCELILQVLQNVFNIIGDIGNGLGNAWNKNDMGIQIVQNLWNSFNNLLGIIKGVGDVLGDVFGTIGQSVAEHFVGIINSISDVVKTLTDDFKYIWDNGGSYAFGQIVEFGGRVINIISDIISNSLAPMIDFLSNILTPVISGVLDFIGWIFDKVNEFLTWLDGDGNGILTGIIDTIVSFAVAWEVLKAGCAIFDAIQDVMGLVTGASGLLGSAIGFLTSPFGIITVVIGSVILIGIELYKHWDELKAKAIEVWDSIQKKFEEFKEWLGNVFATDWSSKFGFLGDIINGFLANVSNIWNSVKRIFGGIIDFIAGVFSGDWGRAWNGIVDIFGGIFSGLGSILKSPLNAVISLINGAIGGINSISIDIPSWVPGFGGSHFGPNISKIPYLAKGGIVDSPTLAMVGEAGKEAVMPLENNTGWIDNLAGQVASRINNGSTGGNRQPAQINVYLDGVLSAQKFINDINEMTKANGGVCPINV